MQDISLRTDIKNQNIIAVTASKSDMHYLRFNREINMKKAFRLQRQINNYKYPLIKLIVSFLLILFSIFRDSLFVITSKPLNLAVTLLCFVITVGSVLCIYIAILELFYAHRNRKASSKHKAVTVIPFDFDRVKCLIRDNDIIELEIKTTDGIIAIGAASDCKTGSSVFFDKSFYIGNKEYPTVIEFEENLRNYTVDGSIHVVSIDGIKVGK